METRAKYLCLLCTSICVCGLFVGFIVADHKIVDENHTYTKQYTGQPQSTLLLYTFACEQDRVRVNVHSTDRADYYMEDVAGSVIYRHNNVMVFTLSENVPRGTKLFISNSGQKVTVTISVDITCKLTVLVIVLGVLLVLSAIFLFGVIGSIAYPSYLRRNFPHEYEMTGLV